jgi:hypothetical protein
VRGKLAPESLLGADWLVDRYPLGAYSLDYHDDVGVVRPGLSRKGRPPLRAGRPFLDLPQNSGKREAQAGSGRGRRRGGGKLESGMRAMPRSGRRLGA